MGRTTKFQPRRHLSQIPIMDCRPTRFMRKKEIAEKMLRPVGGGRPHRFPVESGRGLYPKSSGGSKAPLFVFLSRYPFLFIIPCLFCFLRFPFHTTTFHSTKFSVSHDVFRTPSPPDIRRAWHWQGCLIQHEYWRETCRHRDRRQRMY